MTIQNVEAKLHEARSALAEMRDQEQRAFGDTSRFDHRLSAFLNAGRSVDNRLQHECGATYRDWRKTWNAHHPTEDRILQSMHARRATDFHERGPGHSVKPEKIKVGSGGSYSDKSGKIEVFGSPGPLMGADLGVTISKPKYFFGDRPVTEVCTEYLAALEQMVAQYEADTMP